MADARIRASFLIPGDLSLRTGGYGYDRRILSLLPWLSHVALPDGADVGDVIRQIPPDGILLFDGLAYGTLPAAMLEPHRGRIAVLVHHPLHLETGLDGTRRQALFDSEKAALGVASAVIATSEATRTILLQDFGLRSVSVAEPGTDPAPRARGTGAPLRLLAVGAIVPRKGYDILVAALAPLAGLDWRLDIAGPADRDPACADALRQGIAHAGLEGRVTLLGAIAEADLAAAYDRADLFVMSSLFEGYGMVLGEAMARGLPVVCTTGGACAATVPDRAALKVAPGDAAALSDALRRAIADSALRRALGEGSWQAGLGLPRWEDTARQVAGALTQVWRAGGG